MPTTKERPQTRKRSMTSPIRSSGQRSEPAVEVQTRAPEWALAIRTRASVVDIPRFMGEALPEAWQAAERLGVRPVLPFARYFDFEAPGSEFEPPTVEFEAGVVVDGPVERGEGRVQPVQLPGGEVAVATHVGPYETLAQTYGVMQHWITEHERTSGGPMWEVYLDEPETTPSDRLRTEIVIPLD